MQGAKRRIIYIGLYELIAVVVTSAGLMLASNSNLGHAGALAVATSVIAILWNLAFNWLFEQWESRQAKRGRSVARRVAHAIGFEGGLLVMLVPLFAWWLNVSLLEAFFTDVGLLVFFLIYTFVFNWGFDRVFGLPAAAAAQAADASMPASPVKSACI